MSIDPRSLVRGVAKLASLPEVCVRVNEMVDDPRSSAADIGRVITRDPGLSAQLLRIANSAFFNFPSKISTISRAITVIGERELRYLVLALSAIRTFSQVPVDLINVASFWRHSVYTGVVSKLISERCHILHGERLFVAGLLHDVGLLVLLHRLPDLERVALQHAQEAGVSLYMAEQEAIGCDHAQVGAELLKLWRLPPTLVEAVACHHAVDMADEARLDVAIVHLANVVASRAELSTDYQGEPPEFDPLAWEIAGLDEEIVPALVDEAAPLFAESWSMIQPIVREA